MDDPNEIYFGINIIIEILRNRLEKNSLVLKYIIEQKDDLKRFNRIVNTDPLFVFCFSEKPDDLKDVLQHALASDRPFVIDVVVERDAMGPSVGTWVLPPFPHPEPSYGKRNLRK